MGIFAKFIDIIYPPRCHICRKFLTSNRHEEQHFCLECLKGFSEITPPLCPICGTPFESKVEEDHLCENCLRKRPFYDALGAPYLYEKGVMDAIHQLKYGGKTYLADFLGQLLASYAEAWLRGTEGNVIMPVPLHPKKLRQRGFNQSLLLSKVVAQRLSMELDFLSLRRVRYTRTQTGLNIRERQKNVRNSFGLVNGNHLKRRTVILVDDVVTTGNTINECARILSKAGCDKIFCLAFARTATY